MNDASNHGSGARRRNGGLFGWLKKLTAGDDASDLKEALEEVIEEHDDEGTALEPEQRDMLLNIVSFGELQVDDVMVPRTDIDGIEVNSSLSDTLASFQRVQHSRLPVYREALDEIVGFVHIKDIIDFWSGEREFTLQQILREVLVVPPSMPALHLLARMRATRIHMAIVIDEYGGTDGLVTIEDVVEEIVGEIEDEHDAVEAPLMIDMADGSIDADGRAEISVLEQRLQVDLLPDAVDEEVDTLGGLVFAMLGRIPEVGEVIEHQCGLQIEVTDADARRVKRLTLRPRPDASAE
jgi:CBS domain containing-hemolysin-like protein